MNIFRQSTISYLKRFIQEIYMLKFRLETDALFALAPVC